VSAVLFVGPSFPRLHALELPGIRVRPPAAQGDVLRALAEGARLIGLVDGVFGHEPAVWHKEILAALEAGIGVLGAASMGALRAAELHPFGMEGVGSIFRAYRDGILLADDEVALLHGPAEVGWPALSEPMVNLRATLARLARRGILAEEEAASAARTLAARFYPERTRPALEAVLAEIVGPRRAEAVRRWARRLAVDVKRADAARLLRRLRARLAGEPGKPIPRFVTSRSQPFRRLLAELGPRPPGAGREPAEASAHLPLGTLPPQPARRWTVATFAAADNDLAAELRADLGELLAAPELTELWVAGELDSPDPALRGRFAVLSAAGTGRATPRLVIEPAGPRNTGDPALLRELLRWASASFPGRFRALVLWGHGAGTRIAIDDGSSDALTIGELLAALEGGLAGTRPLDLVVFDACLMAKLELLADLAPFARMVLASGEVVPASGLPYHRAVAILARASDPEAAAGALLGAFLDDAAARRQSHARQVAAWTDRAVDAMAAVGRVGDRLAELAAEARGPILAARLLARAARQGELVDAVDLLERLARGLGDRGLERWVGAAVEAIEACILRSEALWPRRGPMRGGLNLWFPTQPALFRAGRRDYAARPALRGPGAGWLRFLDRLHGAIARDEHHSAHLPAGVDALAPP